ncbi:hypothetical protein L0B52_08700 [Suttonella sp. R2A3]|uniref:hypothetical protein n=1 Tax=Suttonella sp. R2A3 TaxID=2908648 RepID=UPI001F48884A|nr:hypothetical protein [Suttonella sp. R2A3]UJF24399.1 hypothetical protein L0B52_08700 [Suttonella sp. R2A3]
MNTFLIFLALTLFCGAILWFSQYWKKRQVRLQQWRLARTNAVLEFEDSLYHLELAYLKGEINENTYQDKKTHLEVTLNDFLKQTAHP